MALLFFFSIIILGVGIPILSSGHGRIHEPLLWTKNAMNKALRTLAFSRNPPSQGIRIWYGFKRLRGENWVTGIEVSFIKEIEINSTSEEFIKKEGLTWRGQGYEK